MEAVGEGPIALDTCIFIYFMERHALYAPRLRPLFAAAQDGRVRLVTSAITLLEVMVEPLRRKDLKLAGQYLDILTSGRGLRVVPITRSLLVDAALVRATEEYRTPDALQVAAAVRGKCTALLTNDQQLRTSRWVRVVQLDEVS